MTQYLIVSYGGGTNSTAMLVGLLERGERPDAIVFADTGGEKPHTYRHIEQMSLWCQRIGFPPVEIIRGELPQMVIDGSLEQECIRLGKMPAKAYGFGSCSLKWKIEPQQRYDRRFAAAHGVELSDITRLIGFDADEPSRVERALRVGKKQPVKQRFPLYEWDWGREECVEAIARAGLEQPGKSACFFCPSSKKWEILELRDRYPDLLARALEMERRARAGEGQAEASRCGLGRSLVWADFLAEVEHGQCNLSDAGIPEEDCGCYDG
jgi:hypothetical protein